MKRDIETIRLIILGTIASKFTDPINVTEACELSHEIVKQIGKLKHSEFRDIKKKLNIK